MYRLSHKPQATLIAVIAMDYVGSVVTFSIHNVAANMTVNSTPCLEAFSPLMRRPRLLENNS